MSATGMLLAVDAQILNTELELCKCRCWQAESSSPSVKLL